MEARGDVRWDGTFKHPLTPSTAQDMANRVVGRGKLSPLFLCSGEGEKKNLGGGGPTSVKGIIPYCELVSRLAALTHLVLKLTHLCQNSHICVKTHTFGF